MAWSRMRRSGPRRRGYCADDGSAVALPHPRLPGFAGRDRCLAESTAPSAPGHRPSAPLAACDCVLAGHDVGQVFSHHNGKGCTLTHLRCAARGRSNHRPAYFPDRPDLAQTAETAEVPSRDCGTSAYRGVQLGPLTGIVLATGCRCGRRETHSSPHVESPKTPCLALVHDGRTTMTVGQLWSQIRFLALARP